MAALLAGNTLAAMPPAPDGHAPWQEIGLDTAGLPLRALGRRGRGRSR